MDIDTENANLITMRNFFNDTFFSSAHSVNRWDTDDFDDPTVCTVDGG